MLFTSRSQFEADQECARKGFLGYRYRGPGSSAPGLAPKRKSIPLLTGSAVHAGIEILLGEAELTLPLSREDAAVAAGIETFDSGLIDGELVIAPADGGIVITDALYDWTVRQERALIEGLLRAFALRGVDRLKADYEILMVEREGEPIDISAPGEDPLLWQYRTDALLRNRHSGELALQSFKTLTWWGKMQKLQYGRDNQGLSEAWGMERQFEAWHSGQSRSPEWYRKLYGDDPAPPTIAYTQLIVLLKGQRKEDKTEKGQYHRYSPLIRGYRQDNGGLGDLYAWSWDVPRTNQKTGAEYIGPLGQSWKSFDVWQTDGTGYPGGVKAWVSALGSMQPECGDALGSQIVMAEPIPRAQWEKEDWAQQMIAEERRQEAAGALLNETLASGTPRQKMEDFRILAPMTRKSCVSFGGVCPFDDLCRSPQNLIDPMATGLYAERVNHHEMEEDPE